MWAKRRKLEIEKMPWVWQVSWLNLIAKTGIPSHKCPNRWSISISHFWARQLLAITSCILVSVHQLKQSLRKRQQDNDLPTWMVLPLTDRWLWTRTLFRNWTVKQPDAGWTWRWLALQDAVPATLGNTTTMERLKMRTRRSKNCLHLLCLLRGETQWPLSRQQRNRRSQFKMRKQRQRKKTKRRRARKRPALRLQPSDLMIIIYIY